MSDTACLVTTCDRAEALERSLPQIMKLGAPVLVVDDSRLPGDHEQTICAINGADYLKLPTNRGLAAALNIGLSYLMADKFEWISYFQDDVDVDSGLHTVLAAVRDKIDRPILTGRHAREHNIASERVLSPGVRTFFKTSSTGTHLYAHRDYWAGVMPIPTRELGAPKPIAGLSRGLGSNVDWWIVTKSPRSVASMGRMIICVPDLVRTFLVKRDESTWQNEHVAGEDPPLSRSAISPSSPLWRNLP